MSKGKVTAELRKWRSSGSEPQSFQLAEVSMKGQAGGQLCSALLALNPVVHIQSLQWLSVLSVVAMISHISELMVEQRR